MRGRLRGDDADRHADRDRDERRHEHQRDVLREERPQFGGVRRPEGEQLAHWQDSSSSATAGCARGSQHRRFVIRDEHPVLEHADPIRQREGLTHVVRDEHDGLADPLLNPPKLPMQLGAGDRIERSERFVHQHDRRIGGERARNADTLALTAGQLVGPATREFSAGNPTRSSSSAVRACDARRRPLQTAPARARHYAPRSCAERARPPGARSRSVGAATWNPTHEYRVRPRARSRRAARACG